MTDKHLLDMPPDRMEGEVAVALFFEDDRPLVGAAALLDWRLNGHLTRQLLKMSVSGTGRDHLLIQSNGKLVSNWALLVGGGQRRKLSLSAWQKLIEKVHEICGQAGFRRVALCLDVDGSLSEKELGSLVSDVFASRHSSGLEYLLTLVPVRAGATAVSDE